MADDNEAVAITGRPNDTPIREPEDAPLGGNSNFASRAKARGAGRKAVDSDDVEVEDKSVGSSRTSTKRK